MKNKTVVNRIGTIVSGILLGATLLTGCGSQQAQSNAVSAGNADSATNTGGDQNAGNSADESSSDEVRKMTFAFVATGVPYGYVDEDDNYTGYDIEVLRLADELLPQYEFEFYPTTQADACAGTLEGKYQAAITNSFYTKERDENYILPEQFLGVSVGGIITRAEYADVKSFEDAVALGLKYAPMVAGDGWQFVVEEYNESHPDAQIELELVENIESATRFQYLAEGRYDYYGGVVSSFDQLITAEDGALHDQYYGKLICYPSIAVKTYTLISREEPEFAAALNDVLKQLYEDGSMTEVAIQFYGEDVFRYLEDGSERSNLE